MWIFTHAQSWYAIDQDVKSAQRNNGGWLVAHASIDLIYECTYVFLKNLNTWLRKCALTPAFRAAVKVWFIGIAISPTRVVAVWHQCTFHMSTTTMAVSFGFLSNAKH